MAVLLAVTPVQERELYAPEKEERAVSLYDIPLSPSLQRYTIKTCEEYGIAPEVVFAVMWRESRYQVDAMGDNGKAYGLMQIRIDWHADRMARLGITDLLDARSNVLCGIDLLAELAASYPEVWDALQVYRYGTPDAEGTYAAEVLEYAAGIGRR